jgi:type I restriction enzyme S subunit
MFLHYFGDPVENSKGLPTTTLGEIGEWRSGGTPPRAAKQFFVGDVPWFSSGELGEMVVTESKEHISDEALRGMYDTAALKASIARKDCSCNQAVAFAVLQASKVEAVYVFFAIVVGREYYRRLRRGIRQKNMNLEMIRGIRIPLPPLESQRAFLHWVEVLDRVQLAQRDSLGKLRELFASLQHHAFRGEL